MAAEKHLKYFSIQNFKRFKKFELNNIGQFNLIGGDNNVGKTTLLEALLFDEQDVGQTIFNWAAALGARKIRSDVPINFDWILNLYNTNDLKRSPNSFIVKLKDLVAHRYSIMARSLDSLNEEEAELAKSSLRFNPGVDDVVETISDGNRIIEFPKQKDMYFPFVGVNVGYGDDLVGFYSSQIQNSISEERELIENIRSFIPTAIGLGISNTVAPDKKSMIIVRIEGHDKPLPLPMFGEGAVKIFRILVEIAMCKGRRLMIDEIDTGIHYSRFKLFWKTILKAAKKNDVQIFATTHSRECLRFLKETLEEEDMKAMQEDTRYFLLYLDESKDIKASDYSFSQFQFAIDHDNEIRS